MSSIQPKIYAGIYILSNQVHFSSPPDHPLVAQPLARTATHHKRGKLVFSASIFLLICLCRRYVAMVTPPRPLEYPPATSSSIHLSRRRFPKGYQQVTVRCQNRVSTNHFFLVLVSLISTFSEPCAMKPRAVDTSNRAFSTSEN